jgi:MFS family permease
MAPIMAVCAILAGTTEFTLFSLLPLHALRNGYEEAAALELLTMLMLGAVILQYPVGRLADLGGRRLLLSGLGALTIGGLILLHLVIGQFFAAAGTVFLLGGVALAYYVVGLAFLAESFEPPDWPVANAVFIMIYETASLAGPVVGGLAMDILPRQGLLIFLGLFTAILLAPVVWRYRRGAG